MRSRICNWVTGGFVLLYIFALFLLALGTFGLFGAEKDPLAAVFLIPLGIPWIFLVDGAPDVLGPWLAVASPAVNLAILIALCRAPGGKEQ